MNIILNYQTRYWLSRQFGGKRKWTTLQHNGVLFPPEYQKHNIPVIFQNKSIVLSKLAEEYASLYAKYIDTEYVKNKTFNKNFWKSWKETLKDTEITNLEDCNFSKIRDYQNKLKQDSQNQPKDKTEKNNIKQKELEKYGIAIIDGKEQPVGNYRIEPPGIFLGRGAHPKLGTIKPRILPEDITINIDKNANIPTPLPGHKWKKIVHDNTVEWLASWPDPINKKIKYVWLASHSDMKGKSDIEKYELARKLRKKIKNIRVENEKNMLDTNLKTRQIATALYLIDNLALRVGNEKSDDQADTVGVTSLRKEHIELRDNNDVKLDFLGKDSVRYCNKFRVTDIVYKNLQIFLENKQKTDFLFNLIIPADLNKYLQGFMKNLTSKVFRTYNASYLFYKELKKITNKMEQYKESDKTTKILDQFNMANAKVAQLCNHQKNVSKTFTSQVDKINEQIQNEKKKLSKSKLSKEKQTKIKAKIDKLRQKKKLRIELKDISLGTSKINYIDSRITISFLKKHNIPIEKIFSKTLQDKFKWAMDTPIDWKY